MSKKKKYVYVAYSGKTPNLPIAVADTPDELALMVGVKMRSIQNQLRIGVEKYKKVRVDNV